MKVSKYNLLLREGEGYIIFNTLAKSLLYVDEEVVKAIKNEEFDFIPSDLLEKLLRNHILYEEKYDELQIAKSSYWATKFQYSGLGLVIVPTYKCNFACSYCSQGRSKPPYEMGQEVAKKVCKWVVNQMEGMNLRHLNLVFYGGEPLLKARTLIYISQNLKKYCERKSIGFFLSLITNGSLLTPPIIQDLVNLNLSHVQITLDGPPDIHDKRRVTNDGKGTYSLIYDNILRLLEIPHRPKLTIRINVDRQNSPYIFPFIEQLGKDGVLNYANIDIGFVEITEFNREYKEKVFSMRMIERFLDELFVFLNSTQVGGLKSLFTQIPGYPTFCGMHTLNSFVIDPLGRIYKCFELLNKDYFCLGNVDEGLSFYNHLWWLSANPFDNLKCKNCVFLPLCGGGCTAQAYFKRRDIYKRVCPWQVHMIEKIIRRRVKMLYADALRFKDLTPNGTNSD